MTDSIFEHERSSRILELLGNKSILEIIPDLRTLILKRGIIRHVSENQILCSAGRNMDALIIPLAEPIALYVNVPNESPLIGYLQKRRTLCLGQILSDEPAPYTAIAEQATIILSIPAQFLRDHLEGYPEIKKYLQLMTTSRGVRTFKKFLEECDIPTEQVTAIIARTELIERFAQQGDVNGFPSDPGIVMVNMGQAEVVSLKNEYQRGVIDAGAWFGGKSFVPPHSKGYRVVPQSNTGYHFLPYESVAVLIKEAGLEEKFYDDPWISLEDTGVRPLGQAGSTKFSAVPGSRLTANHLSQIGYAINPSEMVAAVDESASFLATMQNFCNIKNFKMNFSSISREAAIHKTLSPLRVATLVERYGFIVSQLKTDFDHLDRQNLPAVILCGGRYAVLLGVYKKHALLVDACQGFLLVPKHQFASVWDGRLLDISEAVTDELIQATVPAPVPEDESPPFNFRMFRAFFAYVVELRALLFNRFALTLIGMGAAVVAPKMTQFLFDEAVETKSLDTIWIIILGIFLMRLYSMIQDFVANFLNLHYNIRLNNRISILFFRQAIKAFSWGRSKSAVGEMAARVGELKHISGFISDSGFSILTSLIQIVVFSAILATYSPMLTGVALTSFPVIFVLRTAYRRRLLQNQERTFQQSKEMQALNSEQISAIAAIKSSASERVAKQKWEETYLKGAKLRREIGFETSAISGIISFFTGAIQVSILFLAFKMASEGAISIGAVFAVKMYVGSLIGPITAIANLYDEIEQLRVAQSKISSVFEHPVDDAPSKTAVTHGIEIKGKIKLEGVAFRYKSNSDWVLREISTVIYPQQTIALVGASGCGKTTLANLICGMIQPTSGRVFFDDFDQSMLSESSLKLQIGMILQNNVLFRGSVFENIAMGDDCPDMKRVEWAANAAGAAQFIERLPQAYNFFLTEGGIGLSGGQKQRIAIARILYRNPKIIIMDEATSALDSESESIVMNQMKSILSGRTAIIIAHRLSTIRYADRILVMHNGEVVEDGDHNSLISGNTRYRELFSEQISTQQELGAVV